MDFLLIYGTDNWIVYLLMFYQNFPQFLVIDAGLDLPVVLLISCFSIYIYICCFSIKFISIVNYQSVSLDKLIMFNTWKIGKHDLFIFITRV